MKKKKLAKKTSISWDQVLVGACPTIFIICLGLHFYFSLTGWTHSLSEHHGFRQTQTAITAFYMIKEGFRLDYITPILGKPWSIPMEFPTYQAIVAFTTQMFKMPLEQAGRLISLISFYLCLIPTYFIVSIFVIKKDLRYIFLALFVSSPIYLFWSRTFMIEPLALLFSLLYLWQILTLAKKIELRPLILTCIFGILAGLTKATTLAAFLPLSLILFIIISHNEGSMSWKWSKSLVPRLLLIGVILYLIPLATTTAWVHYGDSLKSLNPIADGKITSEALKHWNYGTWEQRISPKTWEVFLTSRLRLILGLGSANQVILQLVVMFLGCFVISKYRFHAIICFLFSWIGPFIFINLYYAHDYYWYANSIFMLVSVGFIFAGLASTDGAKWITRFIFLPALIFMMFVGYFGSYRPIQQRNNLIFQPMAKAIQHHTEQDDVLVYVGFDWSSELPYYSERKAIMIPMNLNVWSENVQESITELDNEKSFAGMVIGGRLREDQNLLKKRIQTLNLSSTPIFSANGMDLYLRK